MRRRRTVSILLLMGAVACASQDGDRQSATGIYDTGLEGGETEGDTEGTSGGSGSQATNADDGGGEPCARASDEAFAAPVDVIVSIDQSASMGEEIAGVIDNINTNLVDILAASNIDFRVLFVTGANNLPEGPGYYNFPANVNSSDALTILLWTYDGFNKVPNTCDSVENPDVRWSSALRYDSHKVFIVVSDDDPASFDCDGATAACNDDCGGCANQCAGYCPWYQCPTYADQPAAWGGADFPTELYALEPAGMFGTPEAPKWTFHSIIAVDQQYGPNDPITPVNQVCNQNGNTGETTGTEYQKLSIMSGGMRFPSCNTDYSPVFMEIADTIVPLACKFGLDELDLGPISIDEVNVEFDPQNGGDPLTIPRDDTAPCDGGANGWQWADDYTAIVLCGEACEMVRTSPNGKVTIVVGCATETVP